MTSKKCFAPLPNKSTSSFSKFGMSPPWVLYQSNLASTAFFCLYRFHISANIKISWKSRSRNFSKKYVQFTSHINEPSKGHVLMSLFLSLFGYSPQEFVGNGELNSVETKWTWSICPRKMRFFTRFWGIPWGRTVTGAKLAELELNISIDTPNAFAAAWIAWLSVHSLSFDNDYTKCWMSLLIRDSVYNSVFRKTWSVAARRTIWWLSASPKSWCDRARKKNYRRPTHQQFLNFEATTSPPIFQYLLLLVQIS